MADTDTVKDGAEGTKEPVTKIQPVRQSALARQLARRMDRGAFQSRFEKEKNIKTRGKSLSLLLENRPTKERLKNQGVIKESKGKNAAFSEALKNNQKKDKLNSLFGTRSERQSLVHRGILLTIKEGDVGLVSKEKRAKKLNSLIGTRSDQEELKSRGILKSIEEDHAGKKEKEDKLTKLGDLLGTRDTITDLKVKGIMSPDKIDSKTSLNQLILARPNRKKLETQGIFRSIEADRARRKKFGMRKNSLSTLIASRPNPKALVEQKIIADIGDLPGLNIKKDVKQLAPKLVETLKDTKMVSICSGWGHTIVVDGTGSGHIFGSGSNGRLGLGEDAPEYMVNATVIKVLQEFGKITKVDTGDHHSAAIVDGSLYTWGSGNWGMCGLGNKDDVFIPTKVALESKAVDVACGTYHTIVLTEDNKIYSFGWSKNGRLGSGKEGPRIALAPADSSVALPEEVKVSSVYANLGISVVLTEDGKAYSWGNGSFGGTGHGDEDDLYCPKLIEGLNGNEIIQASLGANFGNALTKTGKVFSWGLGKSGQLGRDCPKGSETPTVISGLENIVSLNSGNNHTFAIDKNGVLYSWGKGSRGVLGQDSETNMSKPTIVNALKDKKVISVTGSFCHSGAVTEDGQVYTWGSSQYGKLGYDA